MFTNSTGAPRTMNGKVIIGNGGADAGARGFVTAFDAETGKQLWRFYTVPGTPEENKGDAAMEAAAKTWSPDFWKGTGGGGTVWNGMTFDAEANRIYIGVGNAGPYDPEKRSPGGGDNLYTSGIVALDADTGKYIWHYQENPRDSWDYKAAPNMVMATLNLEGGPKKVLMHAPTNGFFYVLDRETGKLLNEPKATTFQNWAKGIDMKTGRPIENPDIRYEKGRTEIWPGTIGGHNWQAMSYNPKTGLVYIPIHQVGALFSRDLADQTDDAVNIMGLVVKPIVKQPGDGKGYLVAWDPVKQREVWKVTRDEVWNGGTLSTAGGLVFQGGANGMFNAYDATSGKELWEFNAGLGIIAAPMSFSAGGKQYVSILVGWGGTTAAMSRVLNVGWKYGAAAAPPADFCGRRHSQARAQPAARHEGQCDRRSRPGNQRRRCHGRTRRCRSPAWPATAQAWKVPDRLVRTCAKAPSRCGSIPSCNMSRRAIRPRACPPRPASPTTSCASCMRTSGRGHARCWARASRSIRRLLQRRWQRRKAGQPAGKSGL